MRRFLLVVLVVLFGCSPSDAQHTGRKRASASGIPPAIEFPQGRPLPIIGDDNRPWPKPLVKLDRFQDAVLKHLKSKEREVREVRWYPSESLVGATVNMGDGIVWPIDSAMRIHDKYESKNVDFDAKPTQAEIDAAEKRIKLFEEGGRAVRCLYNADKGFGEWDRDRDEVFIVDENLKVIGDVQPSRFIIGKSKPFQPVR